jgi:predicted transcriptional regulator of viral defense system
MAAMSLITPSNFSGSAAEAVTEELARRRLRTVRLPEDSGWLEEITPHYGRLLARMAERGKLYRAGRGRYVLAPAGTRSLSQAASSELLIDLALRPHGDYYIGFLSALIDHRLTDLHSREAYAAVRQGTLKHPRLATAPGLSLRVTQLSPALWPAENLGSDHPERESFRAAPETKELAWRSSVERTLVDVLLRPELSGGMETAVSAWARARARPEVSWTLVAEIGKHLGDATARRTAFLLGLAGFESLVETRFADLEGHKTSVLLDRSNDFGLPRSSMERDPQTGVVLNVPREHLRGWFSGALVG